MATGRSNKLVGQVGEFLVCAELGRRGLIASPFAGNVPGYDVIATDERCVSVPIQVKTNNGKDNWQFNADDYLQIEFDPKTKQQRVRGRTRLPDARLVHVFVWLDPQRLKDRFFVLEKRDLQNLIYCGHTSYLRRHGGKRPRNPESRHVAVSIAQLEPHEDRWDLVADRLNGQGQA